jgi:hypothetical protein
MHKYQVIELFGSLFDDIHRFENWLIAMTIDEINKKELQEQAKLQIKCLGSNTNMQSSEYFVGLSVLIPLLDLETHSLR